MNNPPPKKSELARLISDLEEDAVLALVHKRTQNGDDPLTILHECDEGMREVGIRYEKGEYFIAGLIMAGEIFREVVEIVQPLLEEQRQEQPVGRVLIGTVHGDIHDLGKNIFSMLLSSHGFEVIDLGVDVMADEFAAKAIEHKPDIIGLSGLITASFEMMKQTVDILREAATEHNLSFPIIIGGGFINDEINRYVGADYWMSDAMAGVRLCRELQNK